MTDRLVNVASRLAAMAAARPEQLAVVVPLQHDAAGRRRYNTITFRELDRESDRLARGLRLMGVVPGTRLALLVRPGISFVSLVFALFKAGVVTILIDPGMGRRNVVRCLAEAEPEGFVAVPLVQAIRVALRRRFPAARFNVSVGPKQRRRWWRWHGPTLETLRGEEWSGPELAATRGNDPAAIIFTSGSTGPPKGVLYHHQTFDRQVCEIRDYYGIAPGEVDVAGFPLFGLFNAAMGVTTVVPDMDASRPARVDPANIVEAVRDWNATQAFASPAVWNVVGPYCRQRGIRLPSLARVLSAGAPVPPRVLETMQACIAEEGQMHTPYGATEALPVASIGAREVLAETRARWAVGEGTCVGRRFPGISWRVIRASDAPLATLDGCQQLPSGEIGELIVSGPVVTRAYVTRVEWNARAKIADGDTIWHRMGDVGWLDEHERFWFCGRLAHRVLTATGPMYTIPCEAVFNQHSAVFRSALVGIGPPGRQRPVIICEPWPASFPRGRKQRERLFDELRVVGGANPRTAVIDTFLVHRSFPVDIRHNAKIFREQLAAWAARRVRPTF